MTVPLEYPPLEAQRLDRQQRVDLHRSCVTDRRPAAVGDGFKRPFDTAF